MKYIKIWMHLYLKILLIMYFLYLGIYFFTDFILYNTAVYFVFRYYKIKKSLQNIIQIIEFHYHQFPYCKR